MDFLWVSNVLQYLDCCNDVVSIISIILAFKDLIHMHATAHILNNIGHFSCAWLLEVK